jgi:hypothetical protein
MKKILSLAFGLLTVFFLSCQNETKKNTPSPSKQTTSIYSSDTLHLSLNYPSNWEIKTNQNALNTVGLYEPLTDKQDTYQENFLIWMEEIPFQMPDSSYNKAAITQIKLANPDLNITNKGIFKSDTNAFGHFSFSFTTADSNSYHVEGYSLLKGKYGYNFSFTSEKSKEGQYTEQINAILKSFKKI